MQQKVTAKIGGNEISIETGKIAKLADGAVTVTCADTTVLVCAVSAIVIKEGQDFFPLTVDYREKAAAAGKFPGGYFKREGRPSENETLVSRLIDRPIRPLFAEGYKNDTQVIITVMQHDLENNPDVVSMVAASAALTKSETVSAMRTSFISPYGRTTSVIDVDTTGFPPARYSGVFDGLMKRVESLWANGRMATSQPPRYSFRTPTGGYSH